MTMGLRRRLRKVVFVAVLAMAQMIAFASVAQAFVEPGLTYTMRDFANCPAGLVFAEGGGGCLHAYITGGTVRLGGVALPITVPGDTIDLGFMAEKHICNPFEIAHHLGEGCVVSGRHGIINGPPEPVPGGLAGIAGPAGVLQRGQSTAVEAQLEWAAPVAPDSAFGNMEEGPFNYPSTILHEYDLLTGEGAGLVLPIKIRLINEFLGTHCYIGSAANPITFRLTTGRTAPPVPNKPIIGAAPEITFINSGLSIKLNGMILVDNSFSVPAASGCPNILDSVIDQKLGLPSVAGRNSALITSIGVQAGAEQVVESGWIDE